MIAVVLRPDGTASIETLPEGLDLLEAIYDLIDTDETVDLITLSPGMLSAWVDTRDPWGLQPNAVAASLWRRVGRDQGVCGTVVFTGGINEHGNITELDLETATNLVKTIINIRNTNQEKAS